MNIIFTKTVFGLSFVLSNFSFVLISISNILIQKFDYNKLQKIWDVKVY